MPTAPEAHDDLHTNASSDAPLAARDSLANSALDAASAAGAGTVFPAIIATPYRVRSQRRAHEATGREARPRRLLNGGAHTAGAAPKPQGFNETVGLTELDPELLEAVGGAEHARAGGALPARGHRFIAGPIELPAVGWPDTTFALLVLRGSLVHETRAVTGRMIEFLATGDLLMPRSPHPHELSGRVSVTAIEEVLLAALDQRFIQAAAVRPELMLVIQRRLGERHHRLALHGAICQLPRVEQRLIALMWHLADRFGKVTADGILITRPLNHQTLADLIGARRPTVTLALKALRERDHLRRRRDGAWLLQGPKADSLSLEALIDQLKLSTRPHAIAQAHSTEASGGPITTLAAR